MQVAQVEKFTESSGLGVSLEASGGHHYVRSVLPEGPLGRCGKLFSGDELLEVPIIGFTLEVYPHTSIHTLYLTCHLYT